jgi:hypothetical protein
MQPIKKHNSVHDVYFLLTKVFGDYLISTAGNLKANNFLNKIEEPL